ncbi:MAG: c-type cytochrome [Pirellula sp.]
MSIATTKVCYFNQSVKVCVGNKAGSMFVFALTIACCFVNSVNGIAQENPNPDSKSQLLGRGQKIYTEQCASCHGEKGEGVSGSYPEALIGDATISELTKTIDETMPEGDAAACVGEDAQAVE